jgi:hypothetical protein
VSLKLTESNPLLVTIVGRAFPFQVMTDFPLKLEPDTERDTRVEPAYVTVGFTLTIRGEVLALEEFPLLEPALAVAQDTKHMLKKMIAVSRELFFRIECLETFHKVYRSL